MSWKSSVAAPFLLVLPFLTSCAVPIAAPAPVANNAKKARYLAELEPSSQYNHPYDGLVGERVMPVAEARVLCDSLGASHSSADAPGGVACAWVSDDTCFIILPDDELAPVVCTENSNSDIMVMQSAEDRVGMDTSSSLNWARERRVLI
jgi:hypothetical protein